MIGFTAVAAVMAVDHTLSLPNLCRSEVLLTSTGNSGGGVGGWRNSTVIWQVAFSRCPDLFLVGRRGCQEHATVDRKRLRHLCQVTIILGLQRNPIRKSTGRYISR